MSYDAIIVGARVAGAATAMLLARAGMRVLALDRARFPSDTLSTHQVQVPGVAMLNEWGLLDPVVESNCPPSRDVVFDPGPAVLRGQFPAYRGVDALYSPRRTVLDSILVNAARAAGAEVHESFVVERVLSDGGKVTGISGAAKGGDSRTVTASMVIGADGKNSLVAKAVGAREYHTRPATSGAFYTYFSGLPLKGGEMYSRDRRVFAAWPTNDGLAMTFVSVPAAEFGEFHADLEANLLATLDLAGDLGARARAATRAERIRGTTDVPNTFRHPYGPGWALVGDAGLVMDPITGQGIGNALQDAQGLADAIVAGLGGAAPLAKGLRAFHRERDVARKPMYDLTTRLARFEPDPSGALLFPAVAKDPAAVSEFFGVLAGTVPMNAFFSPGHLRRLVGWRGLLKLMSARPR